MAVLGWGCGPGGKAQESNGGREGDRLGRVSVAGLAELQQIIQLAEQSLGEPGLQVPPGWP